MRNDEQDKSEPFIMYHGGEISAQAVMSEYTSKVDVLVPFERFPTSKAMKRKPWWKTLFVDSGAFGVSQNTVRIQLDSYIRWLKENQHQIEHFAALDVITDENQSIENWRKMRKEGLDPIPVYHEGESLDTLKEYMDHSSYIGVGAVASESSKTRQTFLDRLFEMFPDRSKVGFHGFGIMHLGLLERYPWKSVDSTSVSTACRFGRVLFHRKFIGISKKMDPYNVDFRNTEYNEELLRQAFKDQGLDYETAREGSKEARKHRLFFSLNNLEFNVPSVFNPPVVTSTLFDW